MKQSLLLLSLWCVTLISSTAFADHIYLSPNDGTGDNFGFVGRTNGHPLFLSGGTPYSFFGIGGYEPGSTFGGYETLYLYPTTVWIEGMPMEVVFPPTDSYIFISSFTLPNNGKSFSQFVEIGFSALGINYETGQTFGVGGEARGTISFYFSPDSGLYYPEGFAQAPEPGTLALMATGFAGLYSVIRKKRLLSRRAEP